MLQRAGASPVHAVDARKRQPAPSLGRPKPQDKRTPPCTPTTSTRVGWKPSVTRSDARAEPRRNRAQISSTPAQWCCPDITYTHTYTHTHAHTRTARGRRPARRARSVATRVRRLLLDGSFLGLVLRSRHTVQGAHRSNGQQGGEARAKSAMRGRRRVRSVVGAAREMCSGARAGERARGVIRSARIREIMRSFGPGDAPRPCS